MRFGEEYKPEYPENKLRLPKEKSLKKYLLIIITGLVLGIVLGALLWGIGSRLNKLVVDSTDDYSAGVLNLKINTPAPDFILENLSSEKVSLSDFNGNVVVLNFWATWCGPCVIEMPMFQEYYENYSPNLVVLGVNIQQDINEVVPFVDELGLSFEILFDNDAKISNLFGAFGLPTTVIIDQKGTIRYKHIGLMSKNQFESYLKELGVVE